MAIPPQLIIAAAQMLKNRKTTKERIKEALAPATDALKNDIAPLVGMGADIGMMYNLRAEDPSMRTGIATGAIGSAAKGFQTNGITGLITGGIMGGLSGAIATGNAKEQKAEADKYTYLNQMYSSVVGADNNLQSALMYAEDGGEIVSAEGETFVPIQTEAKMIGKKLVKEKFIFSDGKIADVNATKPHSEQKKDDVTDITVEGTYVMPVSTKLNKKDLDSLISYSTSNYSENGKNFAVEKVTLRDILGEKFEGSFAEATDIITKKYPVMDSDDDLDPIARITNNENIANRSKIIAHLMRLNEAKINKEPIEEVKLTPSMKAKTGGYIRKYVLGSTVAGDPPGKKKKSEYLDLKDERTIRLTTGQPIDPNKDLLSGQYKKDTVNDIIYYAKKHGVDPHTALAVGLQETGLGTTDSNIGHTIREQDVEMGDNSIEDFIKVLKYKTRDYAKKQGIPDDDEERILQAYNGYGNIKPETEEDYHGFKMKKIYGVPIPKEGINMKENPLYGRQIIDIRDNVIKKNKTINELINTVQNSSKTRTFSTEKVGNKEIDRFIDFKSNIADTRVFDIEEEEEEAKKPKNVLTLKKQLIKKEKGGFVGKYVLKPKMSLKKGGYIRSMEEGGNVGDPPGKKYVKKTGETIIVGNDNKIYWKDKSGNVKEADPRIADAFKNDLQNKSASGSASSWRLLEDSTPKNNTKNGDYKVLEEFNREYQQRWYQDVLNRGLKNGTYTQEDADRLLKNAQEKGYILEDPKPLENIKLDPINSMDKINILGVPIVRSNSNNNDIPVVTEKDNKDGNNIPIITSKNSKDYLVQKPMDWELATPVDGYDDYVKGLINKAKGERVVNPNYNLPDDNEINPKYLDESVKKPTSNYTPKGGYYIPGENKNRYDKDEQGNWYIQKNDGKTWVSANSLPNSAEAIKRLNEESKAWNDGTQINKSAASSSLVKPKISGAKPIISSPTEKKAKDYVIGSDKNYGWTGELDSYLKSRGIPVTGEAIDAYYDGTLNLNTVTPYSLIENRNLVYDSENKNSKKIRNKSYSEDVSQKLEKLYNSQKYKNANKLEKAGMIAEIDPLRPLEEGLVTGLSSIPIFRNLSLIEKWNKGKKYVLNPAEIVVGGKGSKHIKGWDSFFKKKGGYIRKMNAGGPIYPIIPERWRDIWAIDETGQQPYYPMPNMVNNPLYDMSPIYKISNALPSDNNPYQVGVPIGTPRDDNPYEIGKQIGTPRDDNPYEIGKQIGTPRAGSTTSKPNIGDAEVLDMYKDKISQRKGDAVRDAEESRRGYKDLSRRVGMRDLMQLGTGLVGIGLQDRTERRAFKRPLFIDEKYRGLSPQQINQQAEAGTGAGVEAIKQMMNGGGDRVTARLAPILIDKLIAQQGQTRKAYIDQNQALERSKYGELGTIQQFNLDEEARARNEERDFKNKAIAGSTSLINKYISSRSAADIGGYKTEEGINRDLTDKLYKLDNNELQTDMIGKDYEMQITDVKRRIADIEAELTNPNVSLDEAAKASLKANQDAYKKILEDLEKRKIRSNINGQ